MVSKSRIVKVKNLIEAMNKIGFSEEDAVVLINDKETVMIKKLASQGNSMFSSLNQHCDENNFRDFASPIWEEAKKDNLTPRDIDEIIHQVRKAEKLET